MKTLDSSKVLQGVALAGSVAAVTVALVLFTRTEKQPPPPATPDPEVPAAPAPPPAAPAPASPPAQTEVVRLPPPTPSAAPGAPPTGGEVTEMLVVARRIEHTDPKRSRELLNQVLRADPENAEALERLSKKLLTDEQAKTAADLVERCLRVQPNNAQCAAVKARLPPRPTGPPACLTHNPDSIDCLYARMEHHLYDGGNESAALLAYVMGRVALDSPMTKLADGRVKAASGNYAGALPKFAAACALGSDEGCYRADLLRQEGW